MDEVVINYTIAAKFFAIMALTTTIKRHENWGIIGSAVIYTIIIMMFNVFLELLGIRFNHEFSTYEIIFKFSINFFPALLYFWLLNRNGSFVYWLIFFIGLGYFLIITPFTAML